MIFLGLPTGINRCPPPWTFSGVTRQAGSSTVVMANCVLCLTKQTFGWQRTQIFPDRYLGLGKFPQNVSPLLVRAIEPFNKGTRWLLPANKDRTERNQIGSRPMRKAGLKRS